MTTNDNLRIKSSHPPSLFTFSNKARPAYPLSQSPELTDSKEPDLNKILAQFRPVLDQYAKEIVKAWTQNYQAQLQQFVDILEVATDAFSQQHSQAMSADKTRRIMNQLYTALLDWVEATSELPPNHLWRGLQKSFQEALTTMPDAIEIALPADFWTTIENPSIRLKICRKQAQLTRQLKMRFRQTMGYLHPLKPRRFPAISLVDYRRFQPRPFFRYFLELPMAKFLLWEWFQFLQLVAKQQYTLHQKTSTIRDELLLMNVFHSSLHQIEDRQLADAVKKLKVHIQEIRSIFHEVEQFQEASWQRYQTYQKARYQTVEKQWLVAGTAILSDSTFSKPQIAKSWRVLALEARNGEAQWRNHLNAEYGEWQSSLEIALLQLNVVDRYCDIKDEMVENVDLHLKPIFQKADKTVVDIITQVQRLNKGEKQDQRSTLALIKRHCHTLQQKRIPLMMDVLLQYKLDDLGKSLDRQLQGLIEALPDEHPIFLKRDLVNLCPKSQTDKMVLLKAIILDEIFVEFEKAYQAFQGTYQHRLAQMIQLISEISQLAFGSLDEALSQLIDEQAGQLAQVAEAKGDLLSQLAQIKEHIDQLMVQTDQLLSESEEELAELIQGFEEQLMALGNTDTEEKIERYLLLGRATAKDKLRNYKRKFIVSAKTTPVQAWQVAFIGYQQVQQNYFRLRDMTGLAPEKADAAGKLSAFLTSTEDHINSLPYVYQRLFQLTPLSEERFFLARQAEVEALQQAFAQWERRKFTATALIGERGSGITSLLNYALKEVYQDYTVIKMDFLEERSIFTDEALFAFLKTAFRTIKLNREPEDLDDLEAMIDALPHRLVIIAEDLQHVFLRTTYGFDALERFMLFISRTGRKLYWILTCTLYSWEYFAKVINIEEYIPNKIVLTAVDRADIEAIILKRHRASGYQLHFEPPTEVLQSRRYSRLKTEQQRQEYLKTLFFEQLTDLAAGNVSVAMLFWLRSYEAFAQNKLILPTTIDFDPSFLYQLPSEELFTLAALLQHDILSTEDHARIFHQAVYDSDLLLSRMANKGYLTQKLNGYRIHPFLYRPVVQVLKSDNIIH